MKNRFHAFIKNRSIQEKGFGLMALSILLFSTNALLISHAGKSLAVDAWTMNAYRSFSGIFLLIILFAPRGKVAWRSLATHPYLILRGILGGVGIPLYYFTIIHLGAGKATLINCTYPLFATIIAYLALHEKFSQKQFIFLLIAFGGIALFFGENIGSNGSRYINLVAILGAIIAGGAVVTIRFLKRTHTSATIYAGQCVYGLAISLIPFFFFGVETNPQTILILIVAGILVALGQLLMTQAYHYLSVGVGSTTQLLLPIATALGSYVLFNEQFTNSEILGGMITLYACWKVLNSSSTKT